MKRLFFIAIVLVTSIPLLLQFSACKKLQDPDETLNSAISSNMARLQFRLHDLPGDYKAVLVDVKGVQVNFTSDSVSGWQNLLNVRTGTYDLLELVDGRDTLLADAQVQPGRIHQIRLVLGTENFVEVDGIPGLIKLQTPSAQQSGLKLKVHMDVEAGFAYIVSLDFDASKSIVKTGNAKYLLKPVITASITKYIPPTGGIQGIVKPNSFQTSVFALRGTDTTGSTVTDSTGAYLFSNLPVDIYSLYFHPSDTTYKDSVRTNIVVTANMITAVDTTILHQ